MADNTLINAGTGGDTIATDDIGGVKFPRTKLVFGVDGVNDGDVAGTNPLPVSNRQPQMWYELDVPGTTAATYAIGDQFGTLITIPSASRASGGGGWINSIVYHDNDDKQGALDVVFFNDTPTLAADNAVFSVSVADARKILFVANLTYMIDLGTPRYGQLAGISVPYFCTGTSLYVALIARTAITSGVTSASQRIRFGLTKD